MGILILFLAKLFLHAWISCTFIFNLEMFYSVQMPYLIAKEPGALWDVTAIMLVGVLFSAKKMLPIENVEWN